MAFSSMVRPFSVFVSQQKQQQCQLMLVLIPCVWQRLKAGQQERYDFCMRNYEINERTVSI